MKYSLVGLLVGLMAFIGYGQLLDNSEGQAFTESPFFNTSFIKASKIREIRGEYTFKKQGDVMRKTDYVYIFSFDQSGNLVRHFETAKGEEKNDTTVRFYTYDEKGRLLSQRVNEQRGFMTTYFSYDENDHIIKEEIWRDIDTLHSLLTPKIERSIRWNSETMSYEGNAKQVKKKVFNSYGNPYLETIRYKDSLGYLKHVFDLYTITRDQYNTYYTYGNKGWIDTIRIIHNTTQIPVTEYRFTYDKFGNLASKQVIKNGIFTTEYQIIYSGTTGLLSSILVREVSSNFISIIRFSEPKFWD